ncbi:MAG: rRNA maturation RNase YbeY [Gemmatimonadales bacterium]
MTDVRVSVLAKTPLSAAGVARLACAVLRAERARTAALSITFVSPARIRALNRSHFRRDRPTDVIAFALKGPPLVGDVYICPAVAAREAARAGTTIKDELRRLVVHGVLHALGYEHPGSARGRLASAMWRRQERHVRAHGKLAR